MLIETDVLKKEISEDYGLPESMLLSEHTVLLTVNSSKLYPTKMLV